MTYILFLEPSEKPTSNIWPPPQAKDYMKSVKDLPGNIRMIVHNQTETKGESVTQPQSTETGEPLKLYPIHQNDFERATGLVEENKPHEVGPRKNVHVATEKVDNKNEIEHSEPSKYLSFFCIYFYMEILTKKEALCLCLVNNFVIHSFINNIAEMHDG